jgi:M6 family metalloprotease-like protein
MMRHGRNGRPLSTFILATCLAVAPGAASAARVEKGIVVLVEFADVKHKVDRQSVQDRFGVQLNAYVQQMSYREVSLGIDVTKRWYRMPDSIGRYRISPRNLEVDRSRVRKLIDDALQAADAEVDFSKYTFVAIVMGASQNEYGMIGLCGYPGMLGWSAGDVLKTRSGEQVSGVAIFSYQAHLGTLFHDTAHILGGVKEGRRQVPCLYDHDLQAKPGPLREVFVDALVNLGFWDPMSCHYIQMGVPPPGISSWTKLRLNWIAPSKVRTVGPGEKAEVLLGPLEDGSAQTLVIKIPITGTRYYLVENRQPVGVFDSQLPGSGILIMYADDNIAECRQGQAPVKLMNADPSRPHLEGAPFDVGMRDTFQDATHGVRIHLLERTRGGYRILVSRQ